MFGVYLHIPYCRTLCPYCDFVKVRSRTTVPLPFVEAVCREIGVFEGPRVAGSVFFGGGTPSLLTEAGLGRVMEALFARFDLAGAEITLEANPDDVTAPMMKAWRAMGGTGRSELAVEMRRKVRGWKRDALRTQHPTWTDEHIDQELASVWLRGNT